jgi:hypothetical protein
MHAYAVPMPFVHQLVTHLLYLVVLVAYHLPSALAVVGGTEQTGIYTDVCEWINIMAMAAEAIITGATANMDIVHKVRIKIVVIFAPLICINEC